MTVWEDDIKKALARGYCYNENNEKELDSNLLDAQTNEIMKLLDPLFGCIDAKVWAREFMKNTYGISENSMEKWFERVIKTTMDVCARKPLDK